MYVNAININYQHHDALRNHTTLREKTDKDSTIGSPEYILLVAPER